MKALDDLACVICKGPSTGEYHLSNWWCEKCIEAYQLDKPIEIKDALKSVIKEIELLQLEDDGIGEH